MALERGDAAGEIARVRPGDLVERGGFGDTPFPSRILAVRALAQVLQEEAEAATTSFLAASASS